MIDEKLLEFATDRQKEIIIVINKCGSQRKAAKELNLHKRNIERSLQRVRKQAAERGYAPEYGMTHVVPETQLVKGVSTLYDAHGQKLQWVKTSRKYENALEVYKEAMRSFYEELPTVKTPEGPKKYDKDVIPWFQIGDAHLGALAFEPEVGASWDLRIAERELCGAFSVLFDECKSCERCVVNDLGDGTHYETIEGITEASGHRLDVDGRFSKMVRTYVRTMRFIVEKALSKFQFVDIIINQGNHSRTNDFWMAELLRTAYEKTDRVNVLDNMSVFIPYRMGNTFVMVHHSDKTKPERLAQVMSNDFRQDWGEARYKFIDVGHLHHKMQINEMNGCVIEMWNTLAGMDKYTHDHGFRSRQSITRVDRSRTYGEIGRRVLPVEEIRDRLRKAIKEDFYIPPERRKVYTV